MFRFLFEIIMNTENFLSRIKKNPKKKKYANINMEK